MIFRHFLTGNNESNAFIVACDETRDAVLIDAGEFSRDMAAFLKDHRLRLTSIFITHDHFDHTDGLRDAVHYSGAEVLSASGRAGGSRGIAIEHGREVPVGNLIGRVLTVPGHTDDSICLVLPGVVFTGDALFAGSIGGTSSPLQAKQLIDGIRQHIFPLPPEYEIHTGHGPSSTVLIESRYNPFFQ